MTIVNKNCGLCNIELIQVHHAVKYCARCKKEALKINQNKHHDKYKDDIKENNENKLTENFISVVKEPQHLTGKGFNSISNIKCKSYAKTLNKKWVTILKDYGKFDILFEYVVSEYKSFYDKTKKVNLHTFAKDHKYFTYDLLLDIGIDEIKNKANIKKLRYKEDDFLNNFKDICRTVKNPPLYTEFEKHTKIHLNSYVNKYKLKGNIYSQLMKMLLSKEEYVLYLNRYMEHKSNVGKETGILSAKLKDSDYENEFRRVFEFCAKEYGGVPSRRLFNSISNIDVSSYRKKYNKGWLEICEMYGYEVEKNHKSEKLLLNMITDLTGSKYEPQKTWNWLVGIGGKHMYCDGFYPDLNLVVEFDGVQHRKPIEAFGGENSFIRTKQNDSLKEELLNSNNVNLIRIASNTKWHDKEYIKSILIKNNIQLFNTQ